MRVFLYGSLLDDAVLAHRSGMPGLPRRRVAASLSGWQRVRMRGGRWPTLRRWRGTLVAGQVIEVPAAALARLTAYEGSAYRLTRVVVTVENRRSAAWVWIAPA